MQGWDTQRQPLTHPSHITPPASPHLQRRCERRVGPHSSRGRRMIKPNAFLSNVLVQRKQCIQGNHPAARSGK